MGLYKSSTPQVRFTNDTCDLDYHAIDAVDVHRMEVRANATF